MVLHRVAHPDEQRASRAQPPCERDLVRVLVSISAFGLGIGLGLGIGIGCGVRGAGCRARPTLLGKGWS